MPRSLASPCAEPSCPALTHAARCATHQKPKTGGSNPFYQGTRWRKLAARKRRMSPMCERCTAEGRTVQAQMVHHVTPIKDGGAPFSMSNLQSICHACHNREHA